MRPIKNEDRKGKMPDFPYVIGIVSGDKFRIMNYIPCPTGCSEHPPERCTGFKGITEKGAPICVYHDLGRYS